MLIFSAQTWQGRGELSSLDRRLATSLPLQGHQGIGLQQLTLAQFLLGIELALTTQPTELLSVIRVLIMKCTLGDFIEMCVQDCRASFNE
ncbi:hypothetical protein DXO216_20180 [Xanthomonas oryzae pv. oryzae]|nr:hypothetical protein DXO216_20180 [Xanthomonas oryzae pv. oryzae]OLK02667.1 hypothetical protein IXO599_19635 [Xanthomonas oryzae pv. oryzae]PNR85449.1 hypothetical protein LA05_09470 [Xanthomonas oryzae pv. oryzae]